MATLEHFKEDSLGVERTTLTNCKASKGSPKETPEIHLSEWFETVVKDTKNRPNKNNLLTSQATSQTAKKDK